MIPCADTADALADLERMAESAARKATNIVEYSPYAELRDGIRKAIAALSDIGAMSAEVRERMEGRHP